MEKKLFELITKMYSDLTSKLDNIDEKVEYNTKEIRNVSNQVARMENELIQIRVIKGGK